MISTRSLIISCIANILIPSIIAGILAPIVGPILMLPFIRKVYNVDYLLPTVLVIDTIFASIFSIILGDIASSVIPRLSYPVPSLPIPNVVIILTQLVLAPILMWISWFIIY
jgi:hypothetical protein